MLQCKSPNKEVHFFNHKDFLSVTKRTGTDIWMEKYGNKYSITSTQKSSIDHIEKCPLIQNVAWCCLDTCRKICNCSQIKQLSKVSDTLHVTSSVFSKDPDNLTFMAEESKNDISWVYEKLQSSKVLECNTDIGSTSNLQRYW